MRAAKGAVRLVKLNIDEHPQIPGQMGVQSIPAVFAFQDGRPVDGFMGALPESRGYVNLNTATFDRKGILWFTGQNGVYGRVDPASGKVDAWKAAKGTGPYGITTTPNGEVWYASLAGDHIAKIDTVSGDALMVLPPKAGVGPRRPDDDVVAAAPGVDRVHGLFPRLHFQPHQHQPRAGEQVRLDAG